MRLERVSPKGSTEVLVKLESGNPTGSYKDRMAVSVVGRALERGDIEPGGRVVEYTGGSTGMALAFVCARVGLRFTAVSSDAFSEVKLKSMAAHQRTTSSDGGRFGQLVRITGHEGVTERRVRRTIANCPRTAPWCRPAGQPERRVVRGGGALGQTVLVRQFLIFILVLVGINVVLALFGSPLRISIIGSIVLTLIVGGIMGATSRRG